MKALSLKQPYAELVVSGKKTIELRKWNTSFRGEFLIHASLVPDKDGMEMFGFNRLPCGFIVGKALLIDVKQYANKEEHFSDKNKHLAEDSCGNYGFVLKNATRTDMIPAKGKLGFWEFDYNK